MDNPPAGTVTFLFTDIEGSTRLLYRLREYYETLLADHRRILRQAFTNWNGHEVDTQGDAFFVSFSRATQAVCAGAEAQRKLEEHAWPEQAKVRVRMGIHTGEPLSGEEGYVGMDVHRAARIAHVGHGGQVLLSETTTALVRDELPHGVSLCDLGCHMLKDIPHPEHICQLVIEGMPSEFPPLTSLKAIPSEGTKLGTLIIQYSDDPSMINQRIEIVNPMTHLGRKTDNDICFSKDSPVSRHHAIIKARNGQLFLSEVIVGDERTGQPTRPVYGTFVNGLQVQETIQLRDGDEIKLGKRLRIRFEAVPMMQFSDSCTLDQLALGGDEP
jgi:class 3 adenylate cyclase